MVLIGAEEFAKFWALLLNLFPAAANKKSQNTKKVWELAMSPYDLAGATEAAFEYARLNKFFPDISDITAGLCPKNGLDQECRTAYRNLAPYVAVAAEYAGQIRADFEASGIMNPLEAKKSGIPFRAWSDSVKKQENANERSV